MSQPQHDTLSTPQYPSLGTDTILQVEHTAVRIITPVSPHIYGDILVLPGWNFTQQKMYNESRFIYLSQYKEGYRLIMPEMMKSVYATRYFPETRKDYTSFPTLTWVTDTMISHLQKNYGIFTASRNFIFGISTGARGGALVHLRTGTLFTKVILLSGDYDNTSMPQDNLLTNTYGPYESFEERWKTTDNPIEETAKWTAQLYIAHGNQDHVVPVEQSKRFADKIRQTNPSIHIITSFPDADHDFNFWNSENEGIFKFLK